MATATAEGDEAQAAALLARLQAQFGDMDLSHLTVTQSASSLSAGGASAGVAAADDRANQNQDGGAMGYVPEDEYEDESSVEEPTEEELRAWQEAQYKMASWGKEAKKKKEEETNAAAENAKSNKMSAEELSEWVKVQGPPDLDNQESAFFLKKKNPDRVSSEDAQDDPTATETTAASDDLDPILKDLSAQEPTLGGKWKRLYSSNTDGLSYARLVSSLRGYDGPTVLLLGAVPPSSSSGTNTSISNNREGVIGFYTSTPWKESGTTYGNQDCFLFRVDDATSAVEIFRPLPLKNTNTKQSDMDTAALGVISLEDANSDSDAANNTKPKCNEKYQFCHSTIAAAIVSDGRKPGQRPDDNIGKGADVPAGLGVGGGRGGPGPRIHITETLENCRALPYDGTFEAGPLLPPFFGDNPTHSFDVDVMEAWGVGGDERIREALKARAKERSYKEAHRKKNAEVDRTQFLDHFRSDMVHCKAFDHAHHTSGREDDCELESDGSMLSHLS